MKVCILVVCIVIPMLVSVGLYCYGFISTQWSYIDDNLINQHNSTTDQQNEDLQSNNAIQLDKRHIHYAFRSYYGLFGYCLNYKWLNLVIIKSHKNFTSELSSNSELVCQQCNQTSSNCPEKGCCMGLCDNKSDCPSYIDEAGCNRPYQTQYCWKEKHCMWHSILIDNPGIPRYLSSYSIYPHDSYCYIKRVRHYIMVLLLIAAPLSTFIGLLVLFCMNCVDRFYSIPFAFISFFSFTSFLSGTGALAMFLYQWIQARLHRSNYTYESAQTKALTVALNPWIIDVERLGLAFWIVVAAIGTNLFTAILSFCFCCGLQSNKSKLRINVNNDKYAIVHTNSYDE